LLIALIRNLIEAYPTIAEAKIPTKYDMIDISSICDKVSLSALAMSKIEAPKIAGMDNKNEYFIRLSLSKALNIPTDIVAPLLDILENIDRPCPIPIKNASEFSIRLYPFLRNLVTMAKKPVTMNPVAL
jgi:hypothetical protein